MRLIDEDALMRCLTTIERLARSDAQKALLGRVFYIVDKQPIVDAASVVRCETCKHWRACESEENDCDIYGTCDQIRRMTMYDWFCADGEVGTYADD